MLHDPLFNSLKDLQNSKDEKVIYGSLGIPIGGAKTVEVANRSSYVYVRLRDNQNEVIQAFNDTVSPVYDLPVTLVRKGNKYAIKGRDIERYQNWGTQSAFIPRHGNQHSFTPESGGGGDVTFVYGKQFVPLLAIPSGTLGAGNVIVSEYILQESTGWRYIGNTGTANLLGYKPTGSSAVMVLVYVDKTSGNPNILVGSGTYFASSITGVAQVLPYIPSLSSPNHIADFAVRLVSGTTTIGWDNLYDVRQYFASLPQTGTSGGGGQPYISFQDEGIFQGSGTVLNIVGPNGDLSVSGSVARLFITGSSGSSLPSFITGSVVYSGSDGILKERNTKFYFDETTNTLWLGSIPQSILPFVNVSTPIAFAPTGANSTVASVGYAIGTGTSGSPSYSMNGYRARGTLLSPTPVQSGDALLTIIGGGYDGVTWQNSTRIRAYADGNWITGTHLPTRWDFEVTPSGSATRRVGMNLYGDSLNLTNTGTYNVNGIPHAHSGLITLDTNANDVFRVDTPTGTSSFAGTIATLPGGAVLTYTPTSGFESSLVPASTSHLAKVVLYNTTRGNSALIQDCNINTNTITLTTTVPASWATTDVITIASQTVSGAGTAWVDLEITDANYLNKPALYLFVSITNPTTNNFVRTHPFETFATAKIIGTNTQAVSIAINNSYFIKMVSNRFTIAWSATTTGPTSVIFRVLGYLS